MLSFARLMPRRKSEGEDTDFSVEGNDERWLASAMILSEDKALLKAMDPEADDDAFSKRLGAALKKGSEIKV